MELLREERGSVLIESALAYMVGMAMVLGIIELAMMCYTFGVVSEAARVGVRYASVHGADSSTCSGPTTGCGDATGANVASQVNAFAATFTKSTTAKTVTVTYPDAGGSSVPSRVQVAVTYTYLPLFGISAVGHVFHVAEQGRIVY
jgi:Flp pilus assembly protein TadG